MGVNSEDFLTDLRNDFYEYELEKVQHLAIAFDLNYCTPHRQQGILMDFLAEVLFTFGNVKNLTLVCEYGGKKDNTQQTTNPIISRFSTEQKGKLTYLDNLVDLTGNGPLTVVTSQSKSEGEQIVNEKQLLEEAIKKQYAWDLDVALI